VREEPGGNRVDADAVGRPVARQLGRHRRLGGLGGGRVRVARKTGPDVLRGIDHDRPALPRRDPAARKFGRAQEGAVDGNARDRVPGVGGNILGQDREVCAGIVGQQADRAELAFDLVESGGDLFRRADIAAQRVDPGAERGNLPSAILRLVETAAHHRDLRSALRKGLGHGKAHAGTSAGDQHGLPGKDVRRIGRRLERWRHSHDVVSWYRHDRFSRARGLQAGCRSVKTCLTR